MLVWVSDNRGNSMEQVWAGKGWGWAIAGLSAVLMGPETQRLTVKNADNVLISKYMVQKQNTNKFMINFFPPPGTAVSEADRWYVTIKSEKIDETNVDGSENRTFRVTWETHGKLNKYDVIQNGNQYEVSHIDGSSAKSQRQGYITS